MVHESGPRARRRDANVERILEAAMTLVAQGGLEALSMARLADAVDLTPGALYRYFDSKDALLARLVAGVLDELRGFFERATGALPRSSRPLARIFALVHGFRAFARERPHAFGLVALTLAEPRVLLTDAKDAGPVTERALAAFEPWSRALAEAAEAQQLEDGDITERTVTLFALLEGLLQMNKLGRFAPSWLSVERVATEGVRALLLGWGATPRAVSAAFETAAVVSRRPLGEST